MIEHAKSTRFIQLIARANFILLDVLDSSMMTGFSDFSGI